MPALKLDCNIKLTQRQNECINLLLTGATSNVIASHLKISSRTVEDHISALKAKFQARNKAELLIKLSDFTKI